MLRRLSLLPLLAACASDAHVARDAHTAADPPAVEDPLQPPPPSEPAAPRDPRAFDLRAPGGAQDPRLVAAYRDEQWQDCVDLASKHLGREQVEHPFGDPRPGTRLLLGLCQGELDQWSAAAATLAGLDAQLPAIADFIRYQAARAAYLAHDPDTARTVAATVAKDSRQAADAELLLADLLRAHGTPAEIEAAYRAYLDGRPGGPRRAEARYRLAEAELAQGRTMDAARDFRAVMLANPLSHWGDDADKALAALPLDAKQRKEIARRTYAEALALTKVLFDNMRNVEAEKAGKTALALARTPDQKCEAGYFMAQSVFKQRQRMRSAPMFEKAIKVCQKAKDHELAMRVMYQGARAYQYDDTPRSAKRSIELFELAERSFPDSFLADDARLRQAEGWAKLRDHDPRADEHITELLSSLPDKYPSGDMRGEALWRLAWRAYKARQDDEVIKWLDQAIAKVPHDYNWWGEGQAYYWRARALGRQGKLDDALASYELAIKQYPLSYYALLALNRVREGWPERFEALKKELAQPPAGFVAGTPAITIAPRDIWATPGFARAKQFIALGLGDEAAAELETLGLKVPAGRKQVTDKDAADQLWATALLYDHAGWYDKSHWIARWSVLDYKDAWPTAANRDRWRIAYPLAFWDLLSAAAKEQGYPPELFISFVREESAFDPTQESWANAVGLTQMINSTAQRFGKGLGFPINRDTLKDPAKNVAVGSRFLGFLYNLFAGQISLVVPSYNAGEGATWRWLCDRGDWAADEFGEEIPHDEARNYTKRVMNSYFVYSYLADGTIPVVPNTIPPAAINAKRCKK